MPSLVEVLAGIGIIAVIAMIIGYVIMRLQDSLTDLERFLEEAKDLGLDVQGQNFFRDGEWFAGLEDKTDPANGELSKMRLAVSCAEPDNFPLVTLAQSYGLSIRPVNLEGEPELGGCSAGVLY
ncbi:MAG: hypothetical protein HY398_01495 [Candidatus Doudnabacteria bacterium]|nr:hypothetical protein [Candidatus Doudnabacteria bacterium]